MLNQAVDATSQLRVTCTMGASYNVGIGDGLHGSSADDRHMHDPAGNRIAYHLYRDSARTLSWGQLADGLELTGAGSGTTHTFSAHGRVPAQVTPPPGNYSDAIVVTVTY